jgi:hypothetical protein
MRRVWIPVGAFGFGALYNAFTNGAETTDERLLSAALGLIGASFGVLQLWLFLHGSPYDD